MKKQNLRFNKGFHVGIGNRQAQAAEMSIAPGDAEGGPDNSHHGSDQWLYVVEGTGFARVNGRKHALKAGSLIVIEHGDKHEVRNTGRRLLRTLNIYVPPAYRSDGEPLPRGRK